MEYGRVGVGNVKEEKKKWVIKSRSAGVDNTN